MISRLTPRARITLGSLLVAAVLLVVALFVVRAQVATILTDADASLAESDLASFEQDVAANPDEPLDDPGSGVLVYVRSPNGTVQVNTLPHDLVEIVDRAVPTNTRFAATDDEERTFVVVGRMVPTSEGTWALWSARSTSASELALEGLDRVLVLGGLVLLAGFGGASWVIATLALHPVELARAREKQMVSDAAHELRTPLAALRTQLELAQADAGDADALSRHVTTAASSVDRLSSLASNLLELSRLESNVAPAAVSTAAALADEFTTSVDRARMLALATSVTIEFDVTIDDDGARFRIDAASFGRLTDNLFSNAIAAVQVGGAVTGTLSSNGDRLTLVVADDGPGMSEAFLPIAFERFTRPDADRASSRGGSGLGLALVRALARDAGGDATATNRDPGLRVEVTLPKM